MKQGIVIVTWSGGEEEFKTLLNSISVDLKYPILVVVNDGSKAKWVDNYIMSDRDIRYVRVTYDGFELGALKVALELTNWDQFLLLQDTIEILDPSIFDIFFEKWVTQSVFYNPRCQMYLGKFKREVLEKIIIPTVRNKIEAISQEYQFITTYKEADHYYVVLNPEFRDENFMGNYEERWGRQNLVMKDQYIIKRKGTWNQEHVQRIAKELKIPAEFMVAYEDV